MTALAIAGIVTGGAPAMQNLVHEQRLVTHVNQLFGDIQLARNEAIKRTTTVVLCKSGDGAACSSTGDWQNGWLVFVDSDDDRTVDVNEPVIRVQQPLGNTVTLKFSAFGSNRYLTYFPSGESKKNGTFIFCDPRGASNARAILVTQAGRARISDKSSSGGALECD